MKQKPTVPQKMCSDLHRRLKNNAGKSGNFNKRAELFPTKSHTSRRKTIQNLLTKKLKNKILNKIIGEKYHEKKFKF